MTVITSISFTSASIGMQTLVATGSQAWVAPITGPVFLEGCGGGGAGAGGGAGGGGGSILMDAIVSVTSGTTYWIGIGAGGIAPTDSPSMGGQEIGGAGGSTTFSISSSTLLSSFIGAAGGDGGDGGGHNGAAGASDAITGLVAVAGPGYGGLGQGQIYTASSGSANLHNVFQGGAPGVVQSGKNPGGGGGAGPYGNGGNGGTGTGAGSAGQSAAANTGAGGGGASGAGTYPGGNGGSGQLTLVWFQ